ncbi:MAG: asparagine synthase-related protein [Pseudomonadota bacterium]|nr:asparagine synthase-related protein [Pseudomonadota bacterium]
MTSEGGFHGLFQPAGQGPERFTVALISDQKTTEDPGPGATTAFPGRHLAGCQHAERQSVACVGEIYNADDLCRQLGLAPGSSLTHMLMVGWQRWSLNLLTHLNGVFSLVLRDENELLLYRDPSGLRNLYFYTGQSGQISFGTHLDALLGRPETERRLARRSLHEYLRFGDIAATHTLFEEVSAIEAGQLLRWSARCMETLTFPQADTASPASFSDAVEMADQLLQHSVRTRLADVDRPAAFLSGGMDSALLCAMASKFRKDTVAITVGFDTPSYDEAGVAQQIASHLGMTHEVLRFTRQEYLSSFERLGQSTEQPIADPAASATLLAFDHCRSRFDVVIDGTGADEAVGMLPPRHVRLAVEYASLIPRSPRLMLARMLRASPSLKGYAPVLDFEHPADTMIRWRGFTRTEIEGLCDEPVRFEHTQFYRTFHRHPRRDHFERYSALMNAMPSDRLSQATLISGMLARYPYCDSETDRFIRQLRTDYRYLPGEPKRILRALLARYLDARIWDGPKHGFNFPMREFLAGQNYLLVRQYLDAGLWRQTGVLRHDKVHSYAAQFIAGDDRLTFRVWSLVVLGAWLSNHGELH